MINPKVKAQESPVAKDGENVKILGEGFTRGSLLSSQFLTFHND